MLTKTEYWQAIKDRSLQFAEPAMKEALEESDDMSKPEQLMAISIDFIAANKYVEATVASLICGGLLGEEDGAKLTAMFDEFSLLMVQAYKRGCERQIAAEKSDVSAQTA